MSPTEKYLLLAVAILAALLFWQFHREDQILKRFQARPLRLERIQL